MTKKYDGILLKAKYSFLIYGNCESMKKNKSTEPESLKNKEIIKFLLKL